MTFEFLELFDNGVSHLYLIELIESYYTVDILERFKLRTGSDMTVGFDDRFVY